VGKLRNVFTPQYAASIILLSSSLNMCAFGNLLWFWRI
jgi:hypothetical protein